MWNLPPTALTTTTCKLCGESIFSESDGFEVVLRQRRTRIENAVVPLCVKCGYRYLEMVVNHT